MKKTTLLKLVAPAALALCAGAAGAAAQAEDYAAVVGRIRDAGLSSERAYALLEKIVSVGPRLTGSPQAAAAVDLGERLMKELGFAGVHTEPVEVGRWSRGRIAEASLAASGGRAAVPLSVCALGGSVATPPAGLTAPVVEVRSLAEAASRGGSLKGKIVFFNRPMDRRTPDPFAAYGAAADQRVGGASAAARGGAVAVLVRSLTFRVDEHPHTGMLRYDEGAPRIPAAAISTADADVLSRRLEAEPSVAVTLRMDCRDLGRTLSANVIGEIEGSDRPSEIVLLGAHLDSWDLGVGAQDDGSGCAAVLEALALLHDLGLRPRRTVRAVLFMDEEFGGTGGRAYAAAPQRRGERHVLAAESDRGGYVPIGLTLGGADRTVLDRVRPFAGLLRPFGVCALGPGGGGVDVGPVVANGAVPAAVMIDAQSYFDVHHCALDVLASVEPRELELQAVILASLAYYLAQEGV